MMPDFKVSRAARTEPQSNSRSGGSAEGAEPNVSVGGLSGAMNGRSPRANNYNYTYTYKKPRLAGVPSKATRRARIERRRWTRSGSPGSEADWSRPQKS